MGDQDDSLAGSEIVLKRCREVFEGKFRGHICERALILDVAVEVIGVKAFFIMDIFIEDEERLLAGAHRIGVVLARKAHGRRL